MFPCITWVIILIIMIFCSNPPPETRYTMKSITKETFFLTHVQKRIQWCSLSTVTENRCSQEKVIIESLHSLNLNGEVVLSPLLQQFLQQVVEPLRVVKTRVLGEQLNVLIWHLGRNLIILKTRHFLPGLNCTSYHQHFSWVPHDLSVAGQRQAWLVLSTLARWKSHLQLPGRSRSIGRNCIGVLTHIWKENDWESYSILHSACLTCMDVLQMWVSVFSGVFSMFGISQPFSSSTFVLFNTRADRGT